MNPSTTISILPSDAGQRLDRFLSDHLQVPRNQIQQWIREDRVLLSGQPTKASHRIEAGDVLECSAPTRELAQGIEPEFGDLEILYEDGDLVVLDKPAGLVVHPGAGRQQGTLVHRLIGRYPEIGEVGGPGRPGIVHRLDKDTTGLLIIARTPRAYKSLTEAFAERRIQKSYLAVVYGTPRENRGRIEVPIGRHPTRRKEMAVRQTGRPSLTIYRVLHSASGLSALELDLATGRTHQIRVHLKSISHPLVGDPVYGEARWKGLLKPAQSPARDFPRPALHAWRLEFGHPLTGEGVRVHAPLPDDMRRLWERVTETDFPDPS